MRNRERATTWRQALALIAAHPRVRDFRQCGMIFAWEVAAAPPDFARRFFAEALAAELLLRPIGDTVYVMAPYIVTGDEMAMLGERVAGILDRLP